MANAFYHGMMTPNFFGNTCTVIWTGSIKLVHSGWSHSPFVFAKRPHFFDKLHTLLDMSSRLQNHGRYKGRADLPRRIFKQWYWVHRVWPTIIFNVVFMEIPSLDVIKFAHFDIHWKKKILMVFDDSNAQYHSGTVRNCSLRCLWEQKWFLWVTSPLDTTRIGDDRRRFSGWWRCGSLHTHYRKHIQQVLHICERIWRLC